ncbi:S-adenosyl-methyltransferase MraW [Candidatus Liberibacter africanus PTSAPSY]|uniref:Ribosomal RNA small subunit methyltransferase H n=2 Tax=Liberibacter africanus TaxID=34020 RepID=A0A0G3I424_LIBAF|nr:S-adenosyl-methyltransferase MraW [Candidatus Liberibacter africanus PTSAPSY]
MLAKPVSSTIDVHIPVLLERVVALCNPSPGKIILDATFGAGGYSRSFCKMGSNVIALDRDPLAVDRGKEIMQDYKEQFSLFQANFSQLQNYVPDEGVDGIVFDLGVSSMQIDCAHRGFSFQKPGPLDMRMSCSGVSAADVVNYADVKDLTRILGILGEEKQASRIAHAIVKRRKFAPFQTTEDLSSLIKNTVYLGKNHRIHPATRSFQALRIFVNDEIGELFQGLQSAEKVLKCGGVLIVVSFHSLEDRLVKKFLTSRSGKVTAVRHMISPHAHPAVFQSITKKVVIPDTDDIAINRRARSAKLRAGIRTSAPLKEDCSFAHLARLPALSQFRG